MWKTLLRATLLLFTLTVLTGICYPLAVTALAQLCFPGQANGSLIRNHGRIVGSALIGQDFKAPQYFQGRPSVSGYDAQTSGGSNLGPTNRRLIESIRKRVNAVRKENRLPVDSRIPSDLVTTSASGLDPHISPASALLQVPRIAKARRISETTVWHLVQAYTEYPLLGILGVPRVNVLRINFALDSLQIGG